MLSLKQVADEINKEVNWTGFFNLVNDLGPQLNDRQMRFMKARLIEKSIANLSQNIKWVDRVGQDHQLRDIRIETKFATNSITTSKGKWKKNQCTSDIKLTNTLGSSAGRALPMTFDFLMIVDTDCVALVAYESIKVVSTGDGLKASIPYEDLEIVVRRDNTLTESRDIDILNEIDRLLDRVIDQYRT